MRSTPFHRDVWTALRSIPAGASATHAEMAARNGRTETVGAVAAACAANAVAVAISCHRVICTDGTLAGSRGARNAGTYFPRASPTAELGQFRGSHGQVRRTGTG